MPKKGYKQTYNHKRRKSDAFLGSKNPMYGKKLSEESKRKISENNAKYWLGKHLSKKIIEKMKLNKTGKYIRTEEVRRLISLKIQGKKHTEETKRKMSENSSHYWRGKKLSKEAKGKIKKNNSRYWLGKKLTEETRKKLRKSTLKYLRENNFTPRIGRNEKQILDKLELLLGLKIIRQYEVLGYFTDGYCKELNIVIEIDEIPKISEREVRRQREIENELNCKFVRIQEY